MHKHNNSELYVDSFSSATPKGISIIRTNISEQQETYVILAESNNSTDFNDYYPNDAKPGDTNTLMENGEVEFLSGFAQKNYHFPCLYNRITTGSI